METPAGSLVDYRPLTVPDITRDFLLWARSDTWLSAPWRIALAAGCLEGIVGDDLVDALAHAAAPDGLTAAERSETATLLRLLELPLGSFVDVADVVMAPLITAQRVPWRRRPLRVRHLPVSRLLLAPSRGQLLELLAPIDLEPDAPDLGHMAAFEALVCELDRPEVPATGRDRFGELETPTTRATLVDPCNDGYEIWQLLDGPYAGRELAVWSDRDECTGIPWTSVEAVFHGRGDGPPAMVAAPIITSATAVRAALGVISGKLIACGFRSRGEVLPPDD